MTRVLQQTKTITKDTTSVSHEMYKVAFGAIVAIGLIVGVIAFASLGVGIAKAILMII
jgi:hypothetical protein